MDKVIRLKVEVVMAGTKPKGKHAYTLKDDAPTRLLDEFTFSLIAEKRLSGDIEEAEIVTRSVGNAVVDRLAMLLSAPSLWKDKA